MPPDQSVEPEGERDPVVEAGIESFPASDPPGYTASADDKRLDDVDRESLAEGDLLQWMTERLRANVRFRACRFTSVELLEKVPPGKCNWVTAHLHCEAAPDRSCMEAANSIIEDARSRFNVGDARA